MQVRAYLALWRHVGFYLGVDPSIILRHFSSPNTADKFIATTAMHLLSTDDPSEAADSPTIPILYAVSNRAPMYNTFEYNCALTRHILGPSLADRVGLAPTSRRMSIRLHAALFLQRIPHWLVQYYPRRGWAIKRRAVLREGMACSVWWKLGKRRVSFRPRTDVKDGAEDAGGELAAGVQEMETVQLGCNGVKVLARRWCEVLAEMVAVCVGVGILALAAMWAIVCLVTSCLYP